MPDPNSYDDAGDRESVERALEYMDLEPGAPIQEIEIDRVFIGSCTNSRIDDLRAAADVARGKKVSSDVYAMIVPGSAAVKKQAEDEGLDAVFKDAGFDWRVAGCSMCLGMNPDILQPGERCASTSNRKLRGSPGQGRANAPRKPRNGRSGRHRGPFRGHPRLVTSSDRSWLSGKEVVS